MFLHDQQETFPAQDTSARTVTPGIPPARDVSECSGHYRKVQKALQKHDFLIWLRRRQQDLAAPALGLPVGASLRGAQRCPCSPQQGSLWPFPDQRLQTAQNRGQSGLGAGLPAPPQRHRACGSARARGKPSREQQDGDGNEPPCLNPTSENPL